MIRQYAALWILKNYLNKSNATYIYIAGIRDTVCFFPPIFLAPHFTCTISLPFLLPSSHLPAVIGYNGPCLWPVACPTWRGHQPLPSCPTCPPLYRQPLPPVVQCWLHKPGDTGEAEVDQGRQAGALITDCSWHGGHPGLIWNIITVIYWKPSF